MKKLLSLLIATICFQLSFAQDSADYFLPKNETYDKEVPTPKEVLGHAVGKWHVSHDKLSEYMRTLAASSNRIQIENRGGTYEDRPLLLLTISSPENLKRIDEIKAQHKTLTEPNGSRRYQQMLMVYQVFLSWKQPSGANAGLLVAYHLAAAQNQAVKDLLDNIILFDLV